ncbi:hypothetical protein OQA88_1216 [Cercophora sp. LCS_1]
MTGKWLERITHLFRRQQNEEDPSSQKDAPPAEVLLIFFKKTDLGQGAEKARELVKATFEAIGCPVKLLEIGNRTRWRGKLGDFLAKGETPRVIYYGGHGGPMRSGGLGFVSHGSYNRIQQYVPWKHVRKPVMGAKCPVLVILHCCHAGSASTSSSSSGGKYPKELICATGADGTTNSGFAISFCKALDEWATDESDPLSANTLGLRIINEVRDDIKSNMGEKLEKTEETIEQLKARIKRIESATGTGVYKDFLTLHKGDLDDLRTQLSDREESLRKLRRKSRDPIWHRMNANPKTKDWGLRTRPQTPTGSE